jgi:N-acetylglutamate synthase-like GNAT family acetyltransferase
MIEYSFIKSVTDEDVQDLNTLLEQLTGKEQNLTPETVQETMNGGDLAVARDTKNNRIVGTASLFRFPTLLGVDGCIENVIVNRGYRNRGIGGTLMNMLFKKAEEYGWHQVEWTSGDYRTEARNFYRKIPGITHRPQTRYTKKN